MARPTSLALVVLVALAGSARGDDHPALEMVVDRHRTELPLVSTDMQVAVRGPIAQVHHTQRFANPATTPIEAVYVFPLPADTYYPTGPYLFTQTASSVIYTSTAISSYESIAVNIANKLDVRHFESAYPSIIAYLGRETTVQMDLLLKSSPNLRADYQAITSRAFSVTWNNGTNSSQISLGNSNHITDLPYDLPLGQQFMQKLSLKNRYNLAAGKDLAITNT